METQLLIIKNNTDYIRIKGEDYSTCNLDKASVFPLTMLDTVKEHQQKVKQAGFLNAEIFKLILTETPYFPQGSRDGHP